MNNAKAINKTDKTSFSQNQTSSIRKKLIQMAKKREKKLREKNILKKKIY